MTTDEEALQQVLRAQLARVDSRVGGVRHYSSESDEIRRAIEQVPNLREKLDLGVFRCSLTPSTGKPQLLLVFDSGFYQRPVLLKLYGKRRPGEGAVQRYWSRFDVRCAVTLEHGDDPTSWLLMEVIDGHELTQEIIDPLDTERVHAITRELAELMSPAHALPAVPLAGSRSLAQGITRHLEAVVEALIRHHYEPPRDWLATAQEVYHSGSSCLLHGDLFPGNVMRDLSDKGLRIVDSCAYVGDPTFDAARWTVRIATPERYPGVVAAWLEGEPQLDEVTLVGMLGVESLMQAGVREIVKDEQGVPWRESDVVTAAYLEASASLFRRWLSGVDGRRQAAP